MATRKKGTRANPFMKASDISGMEAHSPGADALEPEPAPTPRRKTTSKKTSTIIQQAILEIVEGKADDEILALTEAISTRRDVIREKLNEQVKAIFGEDFEISNAKTRPRPPVPATQLAEGAERPNEVKAEGFAAEGLPDLSMGFGSPSIHESGAVVTAADPMGMSEAGAGEITTTGAHIG